MRALSWAPSPAGDDNSVTLDNYFTWIQMYLTYDQAQSKFGTHFTNVTPNPRLIHSYKSFC